jgi:hypothetical protein
MSAATGSSIPEVAVSRVPAVSPNARYRRTARVRRTSHCRRFSGFPVQKDGREPQRFPPLDEWMAELSQIS